SHALRIHGEEGWDISKGTTSRVSSGQTIRLTHAVVSSYDDMVIPCNIGAGSLKESAGRSHRIGLSWVGKKVEHLVVRRNCRNSLRFDFGSGDLTGHDAGITLSIAFIRKKEEGLVADHRAAERTSKLVEANRGLCSRRRQQRVPGVEDIVLPVLEERT